MARIQREGLPMQITPWAYVLDPQYLFAFTPLPGYRVASTLPFVTPLRASGRDQMYLLERNP